MISNLLNNGPLTPSEAYSDSDEDRYNSPKTNSNQQRNSYNEYPTPSTLNEGSNDGGSGDRYTNYQSLLPTSFSIGNLTGTNTEIENSYNNFNYPISQYNNNAAYQQGVNNELVQPYSVANFDFFSNTNYQQQNSEKAIEAEGKDSTSPEKVERQELKNETKTESKMIEGVTDFLMRPPDSESIAAAAVTAKRNRQKRRTRIKFEKEQLDLLEASFQRTHYPDVNVTDRLAEILKISNDKISVWFQNRRAKFKRSKKPNTKSETNSSFPDIDGNPMELLEAAQKELQEKQRHSIDLLNNSENQSNHSCDSPKSDYNNEPKSLSKNKSENFNFTRSESFSYDNDKTANEQSSKTKHDELNLCHLTDYNKPEDQVYNMIPQMLYPQIAKPPIVPPLHNQGFFQPQLLDQNQFYNSLPIKQDVNESRQSVSPVNSSNQSRSGSPQSDSSENPENSDSNSSDNQQDFNQNQNYPLEQEYKSEPYQHSSTFNPYIQPNMLSNMRPPYYNQNGYINSGEMFYNQNVTQTGMQPTSNNTSNIFQPYADCQTNSSSLAQENYSYLPGINNLTNSRGYFQPYYEDTGRTY